MNEDSEIRWAFMLGLFGGFAWGALTAVVVVALS